MKDEYQSELRGNPYRDIKTKKEPYPYDDIGTCFVEKKDIRKKYGGYKTPVFTAKEMEQILSKVENEKER